MSDIVRLYNKIEDLKRDNNKLRVDLQNIKTDRALLLNAMRGMYAQFSGTMAAWKEDEVVSQGQTGYQTPKKEPEAPRVLIDSSAREDLVGALHHMRTRLDELDQSIMEIIKHIK